MSQARIFASMNQDTMKMTISVGGFDVWKKNSGSFLAEMDGMGRISIEYADPVAATKSKHEASHAKSPAPPGKRHSFPSSSIK